MRGEVEEPERKRGRREDEGVGLGLRLNESLHMSTQDYDGIRMSPYCSGRLLFNGSSASSVSSSLWSSSTTACFPFDKRSDGARLEDAPACPCGDWLADELDIPSASMQ